MQLIILALNKRFNFYFYFLMKNLKMSFFFLRVSIARKQWCFWGKFYVTFFCQKGETIGTLSFLLQIRLTFGFFRGKKNHQILVVTKKKFEKKRKKDKKNPNSQIDIFCPSKYIWFNNIQILLARVYLDMKCPSQWVFLLSFFCFFNFVKFENWVNFTES